MRRLAAFFALAPLVAHAQTPSDDKPNFSVRIIEPTQPRLDCTVRDSDCQPLNLADCNAEETRDLQFEAVNDSNATFPVNSQLIIWVQEHAEKSRCTFTDTASSERKLAGPIALATDPFAVINGTFLFPANADVGTIKAVDFLKATGELSTDREGPVADACPDQPPLARSYRVCFGIDNSGDGRVESTELQGWAVIPVDTEPPTAEAADPEHPLGVTVEDSGLTIEVHTTLDNPLDHWALRFREQSETPATDCTWEGGTLVRVNPDLSTLLISAENGVTVEGCVFAEDDLGNTGPQTLFTGTPVNQCDFVECYPGKLKLGYCAAGAPAWIGVALLGAAAWARRLWRRRNS